VTEDQPRLVVRVRDKGRAKPVPPEQRFVFNNITTKGQDFSGRTLESFSVSESTFESCRFDRLRLTRNYAQLGNGQKQAVYRDCSFDGAKIHGMGIGGFYRFERCSFRNVDLRNWFCAGAIDIVDCVFTGKLRKAVFMGAPPDEMRAQYRRDRNEFCGNDFSGAQLFDVGFRNGIDLTQQRLPMGPDYLYIPEAAGTLRAAWAEAITWTELEIRRVVLIWLGIGIEDMNRGQKQFHLRPKDSYGFGDMKREELDAYFDLLRRHNTQSEGASP